MRSFAILVSIVLCMVPRTGSGESAVPSPTPSVAPEPAVQLQDVSQLIPIFVIQRPHYRSGETIMVRLGFRNASRHIIEIRRGSPPWGMSTMAITGPDGKPMPRGLIEIGGESSKGGTDAIPPGRVQFLTWGSEWYPLDHWSFHLTEPGTYRITVQGLAASDASISANRERSTTTTLTIDP